jgi:hypothetical protein
MSRYRFKGKALEKDIEGYYYPNWDRAEPFTVTASNKREAMTKAVDVLGITRPGYSWLFKFNSIEEITTPTTPLSALAMAWNIGKDAGIAWAQGKADKPLSNPYESEEA